MHPLETFTTRQRWVCTQLNVVQTVKYQRSGLHTWDVGLGVASDLSLSDLRIIRSVSSASSDRCKLSTCVAAGKFSLPLQVRDLNCVVEHLQQSQRDLRNTIKVGVLAVGLP